MRLTRLLTSTLILCTVMVACGGGTEGTGGASIDAGGRPRIDELKESEARHLCLNILQTPNTEDDKFKCYQGAFTLTEGVFAGAGISYTPPKNQQEAQLQCEQARGICDRYFPEASHPLCETPTLLEGCVLLDEEYRNNCKAPVNLLLQCVREVAGDTTPYNCENRFDYLNGRLMLATEPPPTPSCDQLFDACGPFGFKIDQCGIRAISPNS